MKKNEKVLNNKKKDRNIKKNKEKNIKNTSLPSNEKKKQKNTFTPKRLLIISSILLAIILSIYLICILIESCIMKIELEGEETVTLTYNEKYIEPGIKAINISNYDKDNLKIITSLDTSKIGDYVINYEYNIKGKTLTATRNVKIIDDVSPIITLNGTNNIEVALGDEYIESGYTANDEYDGDLNDKVIVTGMVDTTKIGIYPITYSVSDYSNNVATIIRNVSVLDLTPPTITLNDSKTFIAKNSTYVEAGYTAIDNYDGDLTDKVIIKNTVDTSKTGSYTIEYIVKDTSGNETKVTRRINVYDNSGAKKNIYLTFDDGPSSLTSEILKILKDKGVKATFFVSPNSNTYSYLNTIINEGHEVAIHGFHEYKKLYASKEDFFYYFDQVQNKIKEATGITVRNFRFPGGSNNVYLKKSIFNEINAEFKARGIVYFDWNVDSQDASGKVMSKDDIANTVIKQVRNSSRTENVILMHDLASKKSTKNALPQIIDTFLEMGYEFKTVNECSFAPQFR